MTEQDVSSNACEQSVPHIQDDLLGNKVFMAGVRSFLKTEELRTYFDFITDMPMDFLMRYADKRFTQERIAAYLGIDSDRIPSLNKSLRRAFKRQIRVEAIQAQQREAARFNK